MADVVFNQAKGAFAAWARLPATNDALIAVPIETSGIVGDSTMIDYDDLAALLAGASNEQSTMGRKTLSSVVVTVDDTGDKVDVDCADVVWTAATGNAVSAIVVCYDSDTTGGGDASITPISKHDFTVTPDGTDVTAQIATSGFASAT